MPVLAVLLTLGSWVILRRRQHRRLAHELAGAATTPTALTRKEAGHPPTRAH
jgi:hypothetical protein